MNGSGVLSVWATKALKVAPELSSKKIAKLFEELSPRPAHPVR
jgi:hypothetical protein